MTDRNTTTADAELLCLGAEMDPLWDAEKAIAERDETPKTDADFRAARDRTCPTVEKIAAIPATTLAGLRVKAKAVAWIESDHDEPYPVENFEYSLRQEVVHGGSSPEVSLPPIASCKVNVQGQCQTPSKTSPQWQVKNMPLLPWVVFWPSGRHQLTAFITTILPASSTTSE
jgi:hypothetical protein